MIGNRKILFSVGIFFTTYFFCVLVFQKSYVGTKFLKGIHHTINSRLSYAFEHTSFYAQALNNRPHKVIGKMTFDIKGSPPAANYDTKFTFLNTKSLQEKIQQNALGGQSGLRMDMDDYRFSFWHFLFLPFSILTSLWLASTVFIKPKWRHVGLSVAILSLLLCFEMAFTLIYMRSHAALLEHYGASALINWLAVAIFTNQAIEFIYIKSFIVFIASSYKQLSPYFERKDV